MGRIFIARHAETVFNAAARMQGDTLHTPLTRAGFRQAEAMGIALLHHLGPRPALMMWASPAGRALQTLAIIAEILELDWHKTQTDERLAEIGLGEWSGLYYRDVVAQGGPILDPETRLFSRRAPGGEWYDEICHRLQQWLRDQEAPAADRLIVMHGMSSRVLRGMLTGAPENIACGAPIAPGLPQGAVVEISDGNETLLQSG